MQRTLSVILGSINKVLGLKAGGPADSPLLQSCEQAGGGGAQKRLFLLVSPIISVILGLLS